jgi:hypothetical protein
VMFVVLVTSGYVALVIDTKHYLPRWDVAIVMMSGGPM